MARGSKSSYTGKQKRQASHIEKSEKKKGRSTKRAEQIAWATVNKQDGGGKKKKATKAAKKTGKKTTGKKSTGRKTTGKKKTSKKSARKK